MVFVLVVVAYLLHPPWQYALGVVPQFWPAKLYWMLVEGSGGARSAGSEIVGGAGVVLGAGLAYQLAVLWLLLLRFDRVAHR